MEEGDLDGAADDGVHPEPPAGAEHGTGDARAHDLPHQRAVVVHNLTVICAVGISIGGLELMISSSESVLGLLIPLFAAFAPQFYFHRFWALLYLRSRVPLNKTI